MNVMKKFLKWKKKKILKEFKVFIPFDGIKQNADDVPVKFNQLSFFISLKIITQQGFLF